MPSSAATHSETMREDRLNAAAASLVGMARHEPKKRIDLSQISTSGGRDHLDRDDASIVLESLRSRIVESQSRLWAEATRSLLLILQGIDTSGKDGTIRRVFEGLNPQGVEVHSFKVPTDEELRHDFLWRIHKRVPERGVITIFNRSHYEDLFVPNVDRSLKGPALRNRVKQVNEFERYLASEGIKVVKVFLHISKVEQRSRLLERVRDPTKHWKFQDSDLDTRDHWDDYRKSFNQILSATNTSHAPWYVVPADRKWLRDVIVMSILNHALVSIHPAFPTITLADVDAVEARILRS